MKIGMPLNYAGDFLQTVARLREYESVGLDRVLLPEAYSFDAVSQLGYLAAMTTRVELVSSILNIYSRTPSLLAMTAAGLDYLSGGRFILGIGASGPQVVEGFHGVPYAQPLARTREVVEICRQVWSRTPVEHHGAAFDIPLSGERGGTGLGKPLKLINEPTRDRIPIVLAAMGPKNVQLAAELFEGWEPLFFLPEMAESAFGEQLQAGRAHRDQNLPDLDITVDVRLLITDDEDEQERGIDDVRAHLALYIGGMGARGKNFYFDLATRYGYGDAANEVQELYLRGEREAARGAVPLELVEGVSLVGDEAHVRRRLEAFKAAGATTVNAQPIAKTHDERLEDVATLLALD